MTRRVVARGTVAVAVAALAGLVLPWLPPVTPATPAGAVAPGTSPGPGLYQNPLTADDAPDPDIVPVDGTYYAFTTGGTFGHIQELTSTNLATWTPMPSPGPLSPEPDWVNPGLEWAPSVVQLDGTWVMFYATFAEDLDAECITEAFAATVAGPYLNSSTKPFLCLPSPKADGGTYEGGDIDPDVFVGPTGTPYLLWKANPGGAVTAASIWSEPLSADGRSFAPGSSPTELIGQDQDWELTVENPDLVLVGGDYYLFYSGGTYLGTSYAVGYALCAGPSGPCGKPLDHPVLQSAPPVVGPGGESAFQDGTGQWWMAYAAWTAGSLGYPRGARSLRMDPLCFVDGNPVVPGPTTTPQPLAQSCPDLDTGTGYRLVAADGGLFAYHAPFFGSTGGRSIPAPVVATATDPATGGYWEAGTDGSVYPFGAPGYGSLARRALNQPVVGMAATPDGGGYWLVASDGGIFAFGDAAFYGSTGSMVLNQPIVGMAATPDGQGYWLVASDGGIFAFGDAAFYGSTGAMTLNKPVVGMAALPDGLGYWLVASDGGIFAFGDAPFHGSTGAITLNEPVVGMAVDGAGGGYWLVASDGGIFAFGAAPFFGSTGSMVLNEPIVGLAAA
ncbi:MAG TPA: glycoside hydrolase family 43 protein [Acidimicrobiales bacterium]|nr:glycoside hydrolase family 43 protein [Acidimicrobiales bacterium]